MKTTKSRGEGCIYQVVYLKNITNATNEQIIPTFFQQTGIVTGTQRVDKGQYSFQGLRRSCSTSKVARGVSYFSSSSGTISYRSETLTPNAFAIFSSVVTATSRFGLSHIPRIVL